MRISQKALTGSVLFFRNNAALELFFASIASLLAGCIDAIVGGVGLILVPSLFAIFPTTPPATLQYSRRVT